jgi:hypothetical protein
MIGSEGRVMEEEQTPEQKEEFNKFVEQVREEAKTEALQNMSAEQELQIAQNVIAKSGKKFLGSEGKYPFLSEAVNSDQEKLKRVSNLAQWEIERIKIYSMIESFARSIELTNMADHINSEKLEILKLSTSKDGYLLGIAGTEAIISKNTQRVEEDKKKSEEEFAAESKKLAESALQLTKEQEELNQKNINDRLDRDLALLQDFKDTKMSSLEAEQELLKQKNTQAIEEAKISEERVKQQSLVAF